jgi:hypothetical protein
VPGGGQDAARLLDPRRRLLEQNDDSLDIAEACAGVIDRLAKRIEDAVGEPPEETVIQAV